MDLGLNDKVAVVLASTSGLGYAVAEAEIPLRRLGDPREFGAMVAFMASEKASFLHGVALAYDGGASRHLL